MAVVTTESREDLLGNGSAIEFSVGFRCILNDQDNAPYIEVYLADQDAGSMVEPVLLTYGIDYTVDNVSDTGFRVKYPIDGSPLSSTQRLIVQRRTPVLQTYFNTNVPDRKPIENVGDYLTILVQERLEELSRTPKISITSDLDPNTLIEKVVASADKAIADSAQALDITSGMQDEVHAAAEAAIKATAMAEQSTHAHLNLKSLDTIEVDTTGSFELSVNGQRVAMASELPDWSQFAQTDGSNADAEAYQALVGMPEVKNDISELSVSTVKTDGSNITVEEWRILLGIKDGVTAGTVAYYCAESPPDGWLVANGAEISRTDYSDLFTVIGTTFGEGDGTTTFNIPDLRGVFLRGIDNGRGFDIDRAFGSYQGDDNKSHSHSIPSSSSWGQSGSNIVNTKGAANRNINTSASGGIEARPKNVALLPCIKY